MITTSINPSILDLLKFTESHQRHRRAMARATGEHFNIFQVLGIGHYEVKTHSPILAELLHPRGCHGQGEIFLELFLGHFGIKEEDFDAKSAIAMAEYHVGEVTEDSGGRIDIVIQDGKGRRILIENKIYAGDQEKQLIRYRNFDLNARLFYLTLFCNEPSNLTREEVSATRCECVSYKSHIRNWLMDCRKEAACLPGVREMLSQYITLIEQLTHQSTNMEMNKELIEEILRRPESYDAFCTLRDAESAVRAKIIERLNTSLNEIATELGLKKTDSLDGIEKQYGCFEFTSEELSKENLSICFEFADSNFKKLCFGIAKANKRIELPREDAIRSSFNDHFSPIALNESWIAWSEYENPYRYWGDEAFEGARSGNFVENVKAKLEILLRIARGDDMHPA